MPKPGIRALRRTLRLLEEHRDILLRGTDTVEMTRLLTENKRLMLQTLRQIKDLEGQQVEQETRAEVRSVFDQGDDFLDIVIEIEDDFRDKRYIRGDQNIRDTVTQRERYPKNRPIEKIGRLIRIRIEEMNDFLVTQAALIRSYEAVYKYATENINRLILRLEPRVLWVQLKLQLGYKREGGNPRSCEMGRGW